MDSQIAISNSSVTTDWTRGGRDEMTGPYIQPIARQDPFGQDDNVSAVQEESEKRRSTRERKQRTVYDASSGTYVEPRS